jgi:vacuolar-type H+-ATPase subunit E/Vma4
VADEDLPKSVEESAGEKELELRKRETAAADEIKSRAKQRAGEIRATHLDEAEKSITTERNKLLFLTKAENKENLIRVWESAFDRAFAGAESRLKTLRLDPKYMAVFTLLLKDATGGRGNGAFVAHIDPKDEAFCKKTLAVLTIPADIRPDITTAGGVVAGMPDNSVVISNTVESRLERAKELRRKEIHAILTGA